MTYLVGAAAVVLVFGGRSKSQVAGDVREGAPAAGARCPSRRASGRGSRMGVRLEERIRRREGDR
jgi:hypothetical protein